LARVLFVCPVVPAPDRNGLAMRAGVSVAGLHRHHDVTVVMVGPPLDEAAQGWVRQHARRVIEVPVDTSPAGAMSWVRSEPGRRVAGSALPSLVRLRPPSVGQRIIDDVSSDFDLVVVMGTYVAGAVLPLLERGLPGILDAFDDDARTCASQAILDPSYADEVPLYEAFQREVFTWFERVLFASVEDARPPYFHLPNAVSIPPVWTLRRVSDRLNVLFVGNPSYLPNRDALLRLRQRIVPLIEERGTEVRLLHPLPDDDVEGFYTRAQVVAVPLRAAGGSRIKLLEAFAHGCPVVSTPTGARGLDVSDGEELIITTDDEDNDEFASRIVELAYDNHRRAHLATTARAFVSAHHDSRQVGDLLASLVEEHVKRRQLLD
jgi:glycosyltransferase involved in cell wall biosynthesis